MDVRALGSAHRQAGLDLPHHSASGRARLRNLAEGQLDQPPARPPTGARPLWMRKRGLIFLPIGQPAAQYYGGARHGQNLYSSSIVALDAQHGKVRWYFQLTHHDLWDYDAEAAPALMEWFATGRKFRSWWRLSKPGLMFFLDRETGKSVYPVEERPVPQSDVPGEADLAHAALPAEASAAGAQEHEAGRNLHRRTGARKILPRSGGQNRRHS